MIKNIPVLDDEIVKQITQALEQRRYEIIEVETECGGVMVSTRAVLLLSKGVKITIESERFR